MTAADPHRSADGGAEAAALRRALAAVAALGVAAAGGAAVLVATNPDAPAAVLNAALSPVVALGFIGTGVFAWWRRPANRTGALMAAVGFAWLLQALAFAREPWVATIGVALALVFVAVLLQLLLSFPTGRLTAPAERWIVTGAYVAVGVLWPARLLVTPDVCETCSPPLANRLLVADLPDLTRLLDVSATLLGATVAVATAVLLLRRRRAASPVARRALAPVLFAGAVFTLALAFELASDLAGLPDVATGVFDLISMLGFVAVPFAFLAGLLRSRWARTGAVSSVVAGVGAAGSDAAVRDTLAETLGDPSLDIAYWLPELGSYADGDGRPVALPQPGSGRAWTPVARDGEPIAALVHDAALAEDPELVRAAGAAAALALENARLDAELRARVEELRASRTRIVEAGDRERRRLERNLHDGAQQRLVAVSLSLGRARGKIAADPAGARTLLDAAQAELDQALAELRELARGLHPPVLAEHGLPAALDALAGRAPLPVAVRAPAAPLPAPVEAAAYYVAAEALANVARYADAGSAAVTVSRANGTAVIEVRDDGVGGADPAAGSGLRGLADRVAALEGRLEVRSPAGAGTVVRASIPCPDRPA